ncbi:amino acid transporter [Lithospermum erythrorhizon]|uniref:Amino acid transporter n=1 Tax=Lithospermum erythrorhizon TaxID=34254 RepID=A0AAV3RWT9_LITER
MMTSNYSPLTQNNASVDLHEEDDNDATFIPKISTLLHSHDLDNNGYSKELDLDLEKDIDFDNLPLIFGEKKSGSGFYGAVFNLTTTIVGAGIMALPATMKVLGLVLGFILIVLIGVLSEISVELLVRCSVWCKAASYGEVVEAALGKTAKILSEICIIVNNGGVMVVYLIILGDVLSGSLRHIGVFDQWLGHGFWDHRKLMILMIMVVFLAPLCALDRIDSLSSSSAASVALAVLFVLIAFIVAFIKLVQGTTEVPRMAPDFGSKKAILDLLVVIPVMANAYVCHFNVQPIYNELEGRSPQKMNQVSRMTTVICVLVYASTAVAGYLLFGNNTKSDVLTNFDCKNRLGTQEKRADRLTAWALVVLAKPIYNELEGRSPQKMNQVSRMTTVICVLVYASTAVAGYLLFGNNTESDVLTNFDRDLGIPFSTAINYLVRIGYVFHLVLVFPVIHFSLRQTMDAMFFSGSPPLTESRKRCLGWTIVLLGLTYFGSTMIPNIWTAFKFTGATTAVSLGFTFPSLVALRLSKGGIELSQRERYLCWFSLILAVIVSIVGVFGNIYGLESKSE